MQRPTCIEVQEWQQKKLIANIYLYITWKYFDTHFAINRCLHCNKTNLTYSPLCAVVCFSRGRPYYLLLHQFLAENNSTDNTYVRGYVPFLGPERHRQNALCQIPLFFAKKHRKGVPVFGHCPYKCVSSNCNIMTRHNTRITIPCETSFQRKAMRRASVEGVKVNKASQLPKLGRQWPFQQQK